jgi:Dockerin type I domain
MTNGNIACTFPGGSIGNSYYIVLKHRNTLETWSANPVTITVGTNSYDFTNAANKAFGNNQASLGINTYGMFTGDVNQDHSVDAFDYLQLDADLLLGVFGYYATDLNGDGAVDSFDYLLMDPNLAAGLTSVQP